MEPPSSTLSSPHILNVAAAYCWAAADQFGIRKPKNLEGLQLQRSLWGGLFCVACFPNWYTLAAWRQHILMSCQVYWAPARPLPPTVATTSPGDTITVLTLTSADLHHYLTCVAEERGLSSPILPLMAALLCNIKLWDSLRSRRSASVNVHERQVPHVNARRRDIVSRGRFWVFGSSSGRSDDGVIACANILCSDIILPRFTWEGVSRSLLVKGNSSLWHTQYGTFAETPSHTPPWKIWSSLFHLDGYLWSAMNPRCQSEASLPLRKNKKQLIHLATGANTRNQKKAESFEDSPWGQLCKSCVCRRNHYKAKNEVAKNTTIYDKTSLVFILAGLWPFKSLTPCNVFFSCLLT